MVGEFLLLYPTLGTHPVESKCLRHMQGTCLEGGKYKSPITYAMWASLGFVSRVVGECLMTQFGAKAINLAAGSSVRYVSVG